MGNEDKQLRVKKALSDMSECFNGQKDWEIEFLKAHKHENMLLCEYIFLENAENLEKYAGIAEKSLAMAVTEEGADYTGRILTAIYVGIRIKCAPQIMFEKYMYLKEQVPKLYFGKENTAHTDKFLIGMAKVHNMYKSNQHKDIKVPPKYATIDLNMSWTHPVSELKENSITSKGMCLLPIYIADAYAKLLPAKNMSEKQRIYINKSLEIVKDIRALRTNSKGLDKDLSNILVKSYDHSVFTDETHTEYKEIYPLVYALINYLRGDEYSTDKKIHELLHKEMAEEEKAAYGISKEENKRFITKEILPFIFIYLPLYIIKTIIKKFYAPIIIVALLKVVFNVTVLDFSRGIISLLEGIGALISFVLHHPVFSLFAAFLICNLPVEKLLESIPVKKDPNDNGGIYHDVWFETKMPRDIQGFDVNAYAQHLRHGGEPLFGHHSLDEE